MDQSGAHTLPRIEIFDSAGAGNHPRDHHGSRGHDEVVSQDPDFNDKNVTVSNGLTGILLGTPAGSLLSQVNSAATPMRAKPESLPERRF